ncbi:hypothetical protein ACR78F_11795 [Sphingobacterium spiritivorum]|uniref:hypothetical protein n=1 Tax=Sphingobacterium spiritivorum TaxID=258 RepID=UPI003DA4993A
MVNDIDILEIISEDFSAKDFKRPTWSSFLANWKQHAWLWILNNQIDILKKNSKK